MCVFTNLAERGWVIKPCKEARSQQDHDVNVICLCAISLSLSSYLSLFDTHNNTSVFSLPHSRICLLFLIRLSPSSILSSLFFHFVTVADVKPICLLLLFTLVFLVMAFSLCLFVGFQVKYCMWWYTVIENVINLFLVDILYIFWWMNNILIFVGLLSLSLWLKMILQL